jgi:hypothetical protein
MTLHPKHQKNIKSHPYVYLKYVVGQVAGPNIHQVVSDSVKLFSQEILEERGKNYPG